MSPKELINLIDVSIKNISSNLKYNLTYNHDTDTLLISYTIKGASYSMTFVEISDIKTTKEAQQFVQMIHGNIAFHVNEQELY